MKKLLLLCLAIAGVAGTMSAKTIYFIDNWGRSNLQLYAWTGETNNGWVSLTTASSYIGSSNGWHSCYELNLGDYENFLIKHDEYDKRVQTPDLSAADFEDSEYYEYYYTGEAEKLQKASLYTYSFNVTTASSWDNFYIYLWNTANNYNISGASWPGVKVEGSNNTYTYEFKSYINTVGVVFNQGQDSQGNNLPQTCDLNPVTGDNNYYLASVTSSKVSNSYGEGVEIKSSGYATYVSNNPLSIPSGIAYYATDNGTGSATACELTNPGSSTAMLIKGAANTIYHFATASTGTDYTSTNAFKAGSGENLASTTTDGGNTYYNYILNNGDFYAAANNCVASNKAYLQLSKQAGTGAGARVLIFPGDDDTQGISAIPAAQATDGGYYNLSGQRVNAPSKGLYIKNGKKTIVK